MGKIWIPKESGKYWLPKQRFLTVYHHCLQYPEWRKEANSINYFGSAGDGIKGPDVSKPVERLSDRRSRCLKKMEMVEQCCMAADGEIFEWLLQSVTEGIAFRFLEAPCGRDYFYDRYRKFFWLLDRVRE